MNDHFEFSWPERGQSGPSSTSPSHHPLQDACGDCVLIAGILINKSIKNYFDMLAKDSVSNITENGKAATPRAVHMLEQMKSLIEDIKAYSPEDLQLLVFAQIAYPEHIAHVASAQ